jgi:intracellular multiplication protein IcmV
MAIKDIFKVSRKTFFNPSGWLGYNEVKGSIQTSWDLMKGMFIIPEPTYKETFEEALIRQGVTDEEAQRRGNDFLTYAIVFLALSVTTFCFSFYILIIERTFAGCLLGMAVTALFAAQAFRFHFWYFQIKKRKLGCTFEEWKQSWFQNGKGPN